MAPAITLLTAGQVYFSMWSTCSPVTLVSFTFLWRACLWCTGTSILQITENVTKDNSSLQLKSSLENKEIQSKHGKVIKVLSSFPLSLKVLCFKTDHEIFIFKETIKNKHATCIFYSVSNGKIWKIKNTIQGILKIMLLQQLTHITNSVFLLCSFHNINSNLIRKRFNKESRRREECKHKVIELQLV